MLGSKRVWLRIYLQRVEVEMRMWGEGYETITLRRLNQFLEPLRTALSLADEDAALKIQNIIDQLESIQAALSHSEQKIDHDLAQNIVKEIHELRRERTRELQAVTAIDEVVGAYVVYPNNLTPTVGRAIRFRPANAERRFFRELGEVVLRPADEQVAMGNLFKEIYCYGSDDPLLSDLYYWPDDLPSQTFLEPGRPNDLLSVEWSRYQHEKKSLKKSIVRKMADRRIGMSAYHQLQQVRGELIAIQVQRNGSEIWTIKTVERGQIRDESSRFWLEIEEFSDLFKLRIISVPEISQTLLKALQLHIDSRTEFHRDHDEILEQNWRQDSLLKFLNGDIEDERKKAIEDLYNSMLWNNTRAVPSQYKAIADSFTARIARLRGFPSS